MNSQIHLLIVTTLSMSMTFLLDYNLKDTRVVDSYIQITLIDITRDYTLFWRCLLNSENVNKTCDYLFIVDDKYNALLFRFIIILSITILYSFGLHENEYFMFCSIYTIIGGWFWARFCDSFHIWCGLDIFTVYFFIWQFMSLVIKWKVEYFPLFSLNFYRGWLCISMAFEAFFLYDGILRYLPVYVGFGYLWLLSIQDIYDCLHHKGNLYRQKAIEEVSNGCMSIPPCLYYTWDMDDNQSNTNDDLAVLGLADFVMFNLMLLLVLNHSLSTITNVYITIGHIIAVEVGQEATYRLGLVYNQDEQPALPLPVIVVSIYATLLNSFLEC